MIGGVNMGFFPFCPKLWHLSEQAQSPKMNATACHSCFLENRMCKIAGDGGHSKILRAAAAQSTRSKDTRNYGAIAHLRGADSHLRFCNNQLTSHLNHG